MLRRPLFIALGLLFVTDSGLAGPPARWQRFLYEPSYLGYDIGDTHPGYYGGSRYREYYSFGFRDPGFVPAPAPNRYSRYVSPSPSAPSVIVSEPQDARGRLVVQVPSDAEIWIEGVKMKQTGAVREYVSPVLKVGDEYVYAIRARWNGEAGEVDQTQEVRIKAGSRARVDFTATTK